MPTHIAFPYQLNYLDVLYLCLISHFSIHSCRHSFTSPPDALLHLFQPACSCLFSSCSDISLCLSPAPCSYCGSSCLSPAEIPLYPRVSSIPQAPVYSLCWSKTTATFPSHLCTLRPPFVFFHLFSSFIILTIPHIIYFYLCPNISTHLSVFLSPA